MISHLECEYVRQRRHKEQIYSRARGETEDTHQDSCAPDVDVPGEDTLKKRHQPANCELAATETELTGNIVSEGERASFNYG